MWCCAACTPKPPSRTHGACRGRQRWREPQSQTRCAQGFHRQSRKSHVRTTSRGSSTSSRRWGHIRVWTRRKRKKGGARDERVQRSHRRLTWAWGEGVRTGSMRRRETHVIAANMSWYTQKTIDGILALPMEGCSRTPRRAKCSASCVSTGGGRQLPSRLTEVADEHVSPLTEGQ
jgi:hypothetical protein